jgi:hypothetical protein
MICGLCGFVIIPNKKEGGKQAEREGGKQKGGETSREVLVRTGRLGIPSIITTVHFASLKLLGGTSWRSLEIFRTSKRSKIMLDTKSNLQIETV